MNQTQIEKRQSLLGEVRDLMIRMQQGDREAFPILYEKMCPDVYRTIIGAGVKNTDAEDVMQEVFIEVFNKYPACTNPQAALKWINRIAYNKAIDYIRKNSRETLVQEEGEYVFEDSALIAPIEMPEDVMESAEVQRLVGDILNRLPVAQLSVVRAFYFNEMKVHDIAESMQIPDGTVKVYLYRARSFVEKEVKELAKKHGTKLYSVASVPLFYLLFLTDVETCAIPAATIASVYQGAIACSQVGGFGAQTAGTAGATGMSSMAGTAGTAGASGAAGTAGTAGAGVGASVVTGLVAKKIAIVAAVVIVGGGGTAVAVNTLSNPPVTTSTTGSSASASATSLQEKNETAKQALSNYYNSTVVTQYGVADKEVKAVVVLPPGGNAGDRKCERIESKEGVVNTILEDVDNDGVDELLVVTVKYVLYDGHARQWSGDTTSNDDYFKGNTIFNVLVFKYVEEGGTVKEITDGSITGPRIGLPYDSDYMIHCAYRKMEDGFYLYFTCAFSMAAQGDGGHDVAWAKVYRINEGKTEELVSDPRVMQKQIQGYRTGSMTERLSLDEAKDYMPTICERWNTVLNKMTRSYGLYDVFESEDADTCPVFNPFSVVDNSYSDVFSFMMRVSTSPTIKAYNTSQI